MEPVAAILLQLIFGIVLLVGGVLALKRSARWRKAREAAGTDLSLARRPILLLGFAAIFAGALLGVFALPFGNLPRFPFEHLYWAPVLVVIGFVLLELSTRIER